MNEPIKKSLPFAIPTDAPRIIKVIGVTLKIPLHGLLDDDDALYGYMFPSLLDKDQEMLAYLINLILRILPNADVNNIIDTAVHVLIEDYLEYSTMLWVDNLYYWNKKDTASVIKKI